MAEKNGFTVRELEFMGLIPYGGKNAKKRADLARLIGLNPLNKNDMRDLDKLTESCRKKGAPICASKRQPYGLYFPTDNSDRIQATAHLRAEASKYMRLIKTLEMAPLPTEIVK